MSNLGGYQIVVEIIKALGGPKKLEHSWPVQDYFF